MIEIKIFTQDGCPKCLEAKSKMFARRIAFEEVDAGTPDGRAEMLMVVNSPELPAFTIDGIQGSLDDVLNAF